MWILLIIISSLSIISTYQQDVDTQPSSAQAGGEPATDTARTNERQSDEQRVRQQLEFRANEALELIQDWTLRFGGEVSRGTQETTCHQSIRDQFDPSKGDPRRGTYRPIVVSIDWTRLHGDIVKTISNSMGWHKSAVEAIVRASESFASNHTFDEKLKVDYVDVHRLYDIDELIEDDQALGGPTEAPMDPNENQGTSGGSGGDLALESGQLDPSGQIVHTESGDSFEVTEAPEQLGTPAPLVRARRQAPGSPLPDGPGEGEWQTPVKYMKLSRHPNFGDVPINAEHSAVHVPVHIYPADPVVMNSIAWSEELTKVFKNNFVRNPKLTNQYFASPLGFMRLYPAQKWQIARSDPDLYDARMRPWFVAGASSRKDVVILIDSSGSMTGSKRDIAKGVIYEILDTLTDNDHFLVLKFSDVIQQVGVPSCAKMRVERTRPQIPLKNTMFQPGQLNPMGPSGLGSQRAGNGGELGANTTDIDPFYLLPATKRNVRHVKTNFTIATAGIANFSNALITAFEVLKKYQDTETLGSQCNQAIMLITDGSPSDFEDIFNRYNYPNAPTRVFTYMIGREVGDVGTKYTKMMACHNRGFYTHVINLAEVRETVQQYIPVMARPLVLNRTHPTTWTPAYGELTYQMLTDWIWESRRRERARAILAAGGITSATGDNTNQGHQGAGSSRSSYDYALNGVYRPDIQVTNDDLLAKELASGQSMGGMGGASELSALDEELEALDIFGYNNNPDCFWETHRNDLLTTVVQPVYDQRNESTVVEKFLNKNTWVKKESVVRTANLLGVAAADMKINDIIALAPSHRLGANGYAIMLTNNGLVMHHPDLRSVLEPFTNEPSERNARILKPFFSSLDLVQLEHVLNPATQDAELLAMRLEAVEGKTGWRELATKRTIDCQRRVQSRKQAFYYKPLDQFPFSFLIAIPQPYGSHRLEAQVEVKNSSLPEKLTTYFTTSDHDLWSVHPDYEYCDGPSNETISTLLDMFQRIEEGKLDDVQWRPAESSKPPVFSPDKIICDKSLVQALVYDAVATFSVSENCGPPNLSAE